MYFLKLVFDFVEGILAGANEMKDAAVHTSGSKGINANFTSFIYNGSQYKDMEQLPPEAKEMVQNGLNSLEKSGMKIATGFSNSNTEKVNREEGNLGTASVQNDVVQELNPGFKFRLTMTIILLILAIVYIIWLAKLI